MNKIEYPETTRVMQELAKKKNMSIKKLMLKFAKLYVLNNNTNLQEFKKGDKIDSFYLKTIFPKSYKYDRITYNINELSISADDFSFFVFAKGRNSKIKPYFNDIVETNRDLSMEWRKMLSKFNKPALIKEVEGVAEYNKQCEIQRFLKSLESKQELNK